MQLFFIFRRVVNFTYSLPQSPSRNNGWTLPVVVVILPVQPRDCLPAPFYVQVVQGLGRGKPWRTGVYDIFYECYTFLI